MSKKKRKSNTNNDNIGTKKTEKVSNHKKKQVPDHDRKALTRNPRLRRHSGIPLISIEEDPVMGVRSIRILPPDSSS